MLVGWDMLRCAGFTIWSETMRCLPCNSRQRRVDKLKGGYLGIDVHSKWKKFDTNLPYLRIYEAYVLKKVRYFEVRGNPLSTALKALPRGRARRWLPPFEGTATLRRNGVFTVD